MATDDYTAKQFREYTRKIREIQGELPPYCAEFFRGIENVTLVRTRYAYAIDLRGFFRYLIGCETGEFKRDDIRSLTLEDLNRVTSTHVEMYLAHVSYYTDADGGEIMNNERAKARKLATIRSFYRYFCKKGKIANNSPALVDLPIIRDKEIIRLEPEEVANLLDIVENGEGLTKKQSDYHARTRLRDLAILTLFLGTGIRISELVGIDMDDINFTSDEFSITRKGGKRDILVFGEEARRALLEYMLQREPMVTAPGHEEALFLSLQGKRITARSVENLVKKYASIAVPLKKISPHKLRSTYGTALYRETGDIYLVADVLGHKDVNTTRKHYAATSVDNRRYAAKVIKLRDD